ncbi:hypothetical protein TNIN_344401 [Trichonephila inaurata madagascariensis]|uniref:Uncharacterized protein n=1 Tax=Trichonephila inaurata madagascariensis TaxID=2747483 RepID=A0A8X7C847_9ARAC|nr:hypothetical protein TNIN_344401 [Trichonephila inaurata madagascariensis]
MEDSKQLKKRARIFATKLVHCVMRKEVPTWTSESAFEDDDIFPNLMQTEIEKICELNSLSVLCDYRRSFAGKEKTIEAFNKFCSSMSSITLQQEVKLETFLNYAAFLAKMSTYIYKAVIEAPDIAICHISYVLATRYPDLLLKKASK